MKSHRSTLFMLTVVSSLTGCDSASTGDDRASAELALAEAALGEHDLDRAVEHADRSRAIEPSVGAYVVRARVSGLHGDLNAMASEIEQGLSLDAADKTLLELQAQLSAARNKAAEIGVNRLTQDVYAYYVERGSYPPSLDALVNLGMGLLPSDLLDPWKQKYRYQHPGNLNPDLFDVWSVGPDGEDGSRDDVGNW